MNDSVWFLVIGVLFLLLGIVFVGLGLAIWKKQKTDLMIHHHCDKVTEENKPAFCTLSGVGVFAIGFYRNRGHRKMQISLADFNSRWYNDLKLRAIMPKV